MRLQRAIQFIALLLVAASVTGVGFIALLLLAPPAFGVLYDRHYQRVLDHRTQQASYSAQTVNLYGWTTQSSLVTILDVEFVDERTGWAVGTGGMILLTSDGGAT